MTAGDGDTELGLTTDEAEVGVVRRGRRLALVALAASGLVVAVVAVVSVVAFRDAVEDLRCRSFGLGPVEQALQTEFDDYRLEDKDGSVTCKATSADRSRRVAITVTVEPDETVARRRFAHTASRLQQFGDTGEELAGLGSAALWVANATSPPHGWGPDEASSLVAVERRRCVTVLVMATGSTRNTRRATAEAAVRAGFEARMPGDGNALRP